MTFNLRKNNCHFSTEVRGILLNKEEFYELRRSKDSTIVTFCLLKTRQCMIEGDMFLFAKSKYSWSHVCLRSTWSLLKLSVAWKTGSQKVYFSVTKGKTIKVKWHQRLMQFTLTRTENQAEVNRKYQ